MQNHRHPHQIAVRALLIAMGLPIVIFMFLAIRTRQLQSTANPRWASFAKMTGPKAMAIPEAVDIPRNPVSTNTFRSDQIFSDESAKPSSKEPGLSGSLTGHTSIEIPLKSEPVSTLISESQLDLDEALQRLDQLAEQQREHQAEDTRRGTQLLDQIDSFREMMGSTVATNQTILVEISSIESRLRETPIDLPSGGVHRVTESTFPQKGVRPLAAEDKSDTKHNWEGDRPRFEAKPTESSIAVPMTTESPAGSKDDKPDANMTPTKPANSTTSEAPVAESALPQKEVRHLATEDNSDTKHHWDGVRPRFEAKPAEPPRPFPVNEVTKSSTETNSDASTTKTPLAVVSNDDPIQIRREVGSDGTDLFTMTVRNVDLRQFLDKLGELARVKILTSPEVNGQISMTVHQAHLDHALNTALKPRYQVIGSEGHFVIICTVDEAVRLKQENGSVSRRDLARILYDRAVYFLEHGESAKARQQVEASLRHNKDDIDAIRLRNEINQDRTRHTSR